MPAYLPVRVTDNSTLGENRGMSSQTRTQTSEKITTTTTSNNTTIESQEGSDNTDNNSTKTDNTVADVAGRIQFKLRPFPSLGAALPGETPANPCA